ncbi:MAG: hypothetical protein IOD05_03385 [Rhodobacter sp.]|nr:hypothetical protein [Rhodobacter sp.]MCA3492181.1 hypothetical protein [Rhodobacter sp.]MCA3500405.1 hypothetical protein [Rhodobacter sp.]MCA3502306.1 hypothetical protein [Rhodobacter sp.]MCA3506947.1 hypothetical protein [Rhodobacter sp.]
MPGHVLALRRQGVAAFASQGHRVGQETGVPLDAAPKLTATALVVVIFA